MASSRLGRELGLRLLFSPASSTMLVRAASYAVGLGFPVYLSFKALEKKSPVDQEQWLVYWAVYGCFNLLERISDKLVSWFPFYHQAKLAFLLWLQLPNNFGVKFIYFEYMRPFLLRHQPRLDRIVDCSRNEMNNFVQSHHQEIRSAAKVAQRFIISAYKSVDESIRSTLASDSNNVTSTGREDPCQRNQSQYLSHPDY